MAERPTRQPATRRDVGVLRRTPESLFVIGAVSQYIGAAIAIELFDHLHPAAVAWLRVLTAAGVVVVWRRAWRRRWTADELGWSAAFGVALAVMNLCFYMAIDSLPLGNAVAIEFAGPISVAAVGVRTMRNAAALVLVAVGVLVLAQVTPEATARGVGFALCAAGAWAAYIVLAERVSHRGLAVDGLGLGMAFGAVAISVFGLPNAHGVFDEWWLLPAAMATGVFSNAIPYGLDMVAMPLVGRDRFALLQALLPLTATVVGFIVLSQRPGWAELAGIATVIVALVISERPSTAARG